MTSERPSVDAMASARRAWWERFDLEARSGGTAGVTALLTATQWLSWSSTFYLMTVLGQPITEETGWSLPFVVAGLSLGLVAAGLASPSVGRMIERRGGQTVLALGSVVLAIGLLGLGLSGDPATYLVAWTIIGVGMAASLYDAAFATLGRLYGLRAKRMISNLMVIIAGAATLSWPATAVLQEALGWRGTCFCYAALHLALAAPMQFLLLPKTEALSTAASSRALLKGAPAPSAGNTRARRGDHRTWLIWLLAANVTVHVGLSSVLAVHLLLLLQRLGVAYAAAVGFGSVIWLSQAGGRVIDAIFGSRIDPVDEGVVASLLVLLGIALLLAAAPQAIAIGIVLFGIGNGMRGILKGTLPLVLFGAEGYAALIGKLALPTLIALAAGPALGAIAVARWGVVPTLSALVTLAGVNLGLAYALRIEARRSPR